MANSEDDTQIDRLSDEEVAEAIEQANDLSRTGRDKTTVSTETRVEDRTNDPVVESRAEYEVTETEIAGGTILTSYGDAKAR